MYYTKVTKEKSLDQPALDFDIQQVMITHIRFRSILLFVIPILLVLLLWSYNLNSYLLELFSGAYAEKRKLILNIKSMVLVASFLSLIYLIYKCYKYYFIMTCSVITLYLLFETFWDWVQSESNFHYNSNEGVAAIPLYLFGFFFQFLVSYFYFNRVKKNHTSK